jgi:hypothetical protein
VPSTRLPRKLLVAVVAWAAAASGAPACTYDWSVGPAPDAGDAADEYADGDSVEASNCVTLQTRIDSAKRLGRACGTTCTEKLQDECGCDVFVGDANSEGAIAYELAVAAFVSVHCPKSCAVCLSPVPANCVDGYCAP